MRVNIIIHKNADLQDWEEKVGEVLKQKISPLSLTFSWVENEFDLYRGVEKDAVNIAVLAPRKGMEPLLTPIIERLVSSDVRIFYTPYEEAPSMLEDFILFVTKVLGVKI